MIGFVELFRQAGVVPDRIEGDADVVSLVMDSRKAVLGCCFVCMPSENSDSHQYLAAAHSDGATSAIVHSEEGFDVARGLGLAAALVRPELPFPPIPSWTNGSEETPEMRVRRTTGRFSDAVWRLAKVAFGDPSLKLKVIGVTGTNGKTTTAWLIWDMLNLLGIPCAYIGTLGFGLPQANPLTVDHQPGAPREHLRPLANTTPFSIELNAMLAEAVAAGCQAVVMEVSSHALAERRVDGVQFDVAVYTNLTQDHLDYHGTMEAYEAAKWRLFSELPSSVPEGSGGGEAGEPNWTGGWGKNVPGWSLPTFEPFVAALNMDDEGAYERMRSLAPTYGRWLYSVKQGDWDLEVRAKVIAVDHLELALWDKYTHDGTGTIDDELEFRHVRVPLGGAFNVENVASAIAALAGLHLHVPDLVEKAPRPIFENLRPVPGRFEPVPNDAGIGILVDYAHTPDALEKLLATARPLTPGRIITVFGCGGDRDRSKRPLMAKAAQAGSDIVVVTSDNPRTENPMEIVRAIQEGFSISDFRFLKEWTQNSSDEPAHEDRSKVHSKIKTSDEPAHEDRREAHSKIKTQESKILIEPDRPAAVALAIQLAEPGDTVIIAGKGHENYQIIGRTKFDMDDRELARAGLKARGGQGVTAEPTSSETE